LHPLFGDGLLHARGPVALTPTGPFSCARHFTRLNTRSSRPGASNFTVIFSVAGATNSYSQAERSHVSPVSTNDNFVGVISPSVNVAGFSRSSHATPLAFWWR